MTRRRAGKALAALAGGAALLWLTAPYNIAASVAHLPGVGWALHGYLHNAVRTWSLGVERPDWVDLDDPALVALGAAHYETGCAPCHGAPGRPRSPTVLGMRPAPTALDETVGRYDDAELFWIVRNGFKYTGMPAWPAQVRADEPWALAAFLRGYPDLDAAGYRALAYGPAEAPPDGGAQRLGAGGGCDRCHGADGLGRDGVAPRLAGQSEVHLRRALDEYAEGVRRSGIMQPIAAAMADEARARAAARYAAMPPFPPVAGLDPDLIAAGGRLARRGDPARETPACVGCHGDGGATARPEIPAIAGQHPRWIATWLRLWREGEFSDGRWANVMHAAARRLGEPEVAALAAFFAAGAPEAGEPAAGSQGSVAGAGGGGG